jgi:DNA-binding MarR family transcriptional regulator
MRNLECCDRALVACCGITATQSYTLLVLTELGTVTMNELATEMRLHGTTMTRMVDSLVKKGLAERTHDPEDRRIVRVGLTADGRRTIEELQDQRRTFLGAAFSGLSKEEQDAILKALRRLTATAEDLGSRCGATC